jgi:hypothetical protein
MKKKKKSPEEIKMDKWIKTMDEDVPSTHDGESISATEKRTGRGFWGNSHSGYLTDDYVRNMP